MVTRSDSFDSGPLGAADRVTAHQQRSAGRVSSRATQDLVRMIFGSHVYGTNTPQSDRDYKSVFIPSADELLFQRAPKVSINRSTGPVDAKNSPEDVDEEAFSVAGYLKLLCEGQTVAVDMLFVPEQFYQMEPHPVWNEIRDWQGHFLSRNVAAFVGYCQTQANKYGIKGSRMAAVRNAIAVLSDLPGQSRLSEVWTELKPLLDMEHGSEVSTPHPHTGVAVRHLDVCGRKAPETLKVFRALEMYRLLFDRYGERARAAEKNEGIDWKALMHAVRVLGQAVELLDTGEITFPRPNADELLKIRLGKVPYRQVAEQIEAGVEELPRHQEKSVLREKPNRELADAIVKDAHLEAIREAYPV